MANFKAEIDPTQERNFWLGLEVFIEEDPL
jgi:hypothetical protein